MAFVLATVETGGYISWWKTLIVVILLLIWTRLLTWIDKDSDAARLNRPLMNSGMFAGLVLGFVAFLLVPGFILGLVALIVFFAADIGAYLLFRKQTIGLGDLEGSFRVWLKGLVGSNKPKKVVIVAGQVTVMDKRAVPQPIPANDAPERVSYDASQALLTRPLRLGAERIDLIAGDPVAISYSIDGVRYEGEAMAPDAAAAAVTYLKIAAAMDMNERRKPQTGLFKITLDGARRDIQMITRGSSAGESLALITDPKKRHALRLEELGLSEDQLELMKKSIAEGGGVILVTAPKAHGLTSMLYGIIRAHDAFLHHIHTVERQPDEDLEGITQNALAANVSPADEAKQVSWVLSQEPDVVALTLIESPASAADISRFASDSRRVYVGMRAANTFEAIKLWRKLVGDDALAMKNLKMVIAGRLIRRLCGACKVGYTADPSTLRKLNMNPEEVGSLYMARKEPMVDAKGKPVPCNFCHSLAFKGRMGVFEIFQIDDEARQVVAAGGSENQLKQVFRKQHGRLIQEQALAQVKAGETSVEEVLRVLKADAPGRPDAASGGAAAAPPPPRPPGQSKTVKRSP